MFARIEGAAVAAYPVDLRAAHPNTSFPWDWPGGVVEGVEYARVLPVDVPQTNHTQNHIEGTPDLIDGVWTQTWIVTDATPEQIVERTAEKASMVRADRNQRLSACDWTQLADAPLTNTATAAWAAYRQALRDLSTQAGFPWSITWPTPPQ